MHDKTFAENLELEVEGSWWKNKKTGETGFITDVQKKKGLIIFRFFQSGHVGSFTNMEFLREFEILASHPDDVPVKVDSIWKSRKTGDIVKVLIEPDVSYPSVHYINLNDTTGDQMMLRVDKAVFITEHTFLRDNDNGALYRHNKNPNTYLKVIETTKKPTVMGAIDYVKYRVIKGDSIEDGHVCLIVTFHSCCHLLSLDPEKEYTIPKDSVRTIKAEENKMLEIKYGSIWTDIKTGKDIFKVSHMLPQNDKLFVHYVDIETGIERAEPTEDFVARFKLLMNNDLSAIYENREDPSEWVQVVICDSSTCVNYHHYGGKFNGREDENDITTFHKQYKLITFYPTDADIERMKLHGIAKKFHKIAKELKDVAKECDITLGSIWKEVRGCDPEDIGSLVKVTAISDSGNIIDWVRLGVKPKDMNVLGVKTHGSTCKSSFLYCFERPCDHITTPHQIAWPGAIWYHTNGGVHIAITIKEENGTVSFVSSDNKALDLYWQMPFKEWVETYKLYNGFDKPPCFPEGSFDEMLEETKDRYERVVEKLKEGESKMENSKETYLNTDESKMKEFNTGAKREDKSGKGRYDLIPGDIMADFINYAWREYFNEGPMTICDTDISLNAYFDDMTDEELFFEFILNMTCLFFTDHEKLDETTDCVGERSYVVTWDDFHKALYEMRELLAKHYEAGAKVHGVNNWKKGIPISDSERGGNFVDSMRRHTDQALRGLDDEPHAISAIWNAFAAIWTIRNKPANTTNSSETKPEAEVKSEDREAEYLTLPSGRKIKIEFVHARTDYEKDIAFLNALRMDKRAINDIMKTLNKVNHPEDNQK